MATRLLRIGWLLSPHSVVTWRSQAEHCRTPPEEEASNAAGLCAKGVADNRSSLMAREPMSVASQIRAFRPETAVAHLAIDVVLF